MAVRRECGFGCVVCGEAICDYHHFDPSFKDARQHAVSRIALLCGACHGRAGSGPLLSTQRVRLARKEPFCLSKKTWHTRVDFSSQPFLVVLGDAHFVAPRTVLRVLGEDLLSIQAPEEAGAPIRVSGRFFDACGREVVCLEENIVRGSTEAWDAGWSGGSLSIKRGPRDLALRLRVDADRNHVLIERLNMWYKGIAISVCGGWLRINHNSAEVWARGSVENADCCIDIRRPEPRRIDNA